MNRRWVNEQKSKANKAYYCQDGHSKETPSEYYICKSTLLKTVFRMADSEIMADIMCCAPAKWSSVLSEQFYDDLVEFQAAIKFNEEALLRLDSESSYRPFYHSRNPSSSDPSYTMCTHLAGAHPDLPPPPFPKDDANITKRKKTPDDAGAHPCHHCGSGKHWDRECKHASNRTARTRLANTSSDFLEAQDEYDNAFDDVSTEEDF
ncbi:hypothetical protein FISHEDRAFT_42813 [Fistulina hepatica ATCC 64428]|uniref:Uncharacterized protein n=1 Tax=Fistulina hepatica ATCC 64428 TaxID=1128425 RepID=A0A0D7AE81_9AGAR|nr:hypothetical protein FISHEDRAFT_42813 [Fistulina hepatica ATCC 64428]